MKNLRRTPNITIQKSDKGSSVVVLNKKVHLEKINKILYKNKQFLKLSIQELKHYNFLINLEKKIRQPLKELYEININTEKTYDKICPFDSKYENLLRNYMK